MKRGKRKDKTLIIVIVFILVALFLIGRPLVGPIVEKTRYDSYLNDLTISLNDANEAGDPVIAVMDGEEYELDQYSTGTIYRRVVDIGTGMKIKGEAGEEVFSIKFPDGSSLDFREGEVTQGARKGRKGVYIYYTGATGKKYDYCCDMSTYQSMKAVLEDQIFWENYEQETETEEEKMKRVEEKAKEKMSEKENGEDQDG